MSEEAKILAQILAEMKGIRKEQKSIREGQEVQRLLILAMAEAMVANPSVFGQQNIAYNLQRIQEQT
ncbi:MAG TPA: hypothetical protein VFU96_02290 [Acidimicrobiia bacterium]|nr:hypothetical protein [Acidimicrobiia bacterium]